jgi:hypothetical protein
VSNFYIDKKKTYINIAQKKPYQYKREWESIHKSFTKSTLDRSRRNLCFKNVICMKLVDEYTPVELPVFRSL